MRKPPVRARELGRVELKSRYFPSGEKRGFELSVLGDVYRVASPPATGTTHTSLWRLFSASRTVVTVNATSFPSGETAGPLNVVTLYQSAGVNARFAPPPGAVGAGPVWAPTGNASATHRSAIAVETERVDAGFTIAPRSGESSAVSECTITHRRLDPLAMPFLHSIVPKASLRDGSRGFPFSVPVVRALESLEFPTAVTFFVGENGSGKSTLLEAIAAAVGVPTVGSEGVRDDATLAAQRALAKHLRLAWTHRTHKGFFLRAEDFFGFTKYLARLRAELRTRLAEIEVEYADRSAYARGLARGPMASSLADMERRYGVDLDANSHGESFLKLFRSRFVPGGLYLLDEPEAPLSPQSQLGLIAMLKEMLTQEAQFIIATHSPILLAFPNATIYTFDEQPPKRVEYEELEHVRLTRDFLNDPEAFLRHL